MTAATPLAVTVADAEALRALPTSARPRVDPADVVVPAGYRVEVVLVGLSMPCGMGFADDGTLFVLEGGSTWPTRPYVPARILRLDPQGRLDVVAEEGLGGPRHVAVYGDTILVSCKGGRNARIDRINLTNGRRDVLVDGLPNGGWHEPGGPVFGPDGLMYFAQGSVTQQGVVLPQGFQVDLARHMGVHDVPGEDVVLTGNNVQTYDPTGPYPYLVETGPFKPFGTPAGRGEVVKGQLKCSSGLWRAQPDGTEMELVAWGIRNPYGMVFGEDGELYVSDNDFEETGDRAVQADPDRVWRIDAARTPHGSLDRPAWYGFPDVCGDGLPVWHDSHQPRRGTPAKPLLENPPPWAGPAVFLEKPHSALTGLDVSRSDAFGYRGRLFLCEWGTLAPLNSPDSRDLENGFRVVAVDPTDGSAEAFMRNPRPGPASALGTGGLERPVDAKFAPDGSLYVLDFGVSRVMETTHVSYGHTGVLWRVVRDGSRP
ncbi:PQQ-dependent sugar dehydrogenase [Micromonospora sp. URMC 103]|uniref:PQQ-dependent sugar dehydrogenase n=1 Tax=Micromonospora sp. URMC 103 TaxID=3423406 RepID=UPI003F1A0FAF